MLNYTRPEGVPEDANPIAPVVRSPIQVLIEEYQAEGVPLPAWLANAAPQANVQAATIQSIQATNAHMNAQATLRDQNALRDWQANVPLYLAAGISPPPQPKPNPKIVDKVVFAKTDGTVQTGADASSGKYVAWMWQEYES
jgi:hypothetical protein